tara:strand:+ start:36 stop:1034 length:999 start_codon:yes stop_codon:yes gene_type:complete
MVKQSLIFSLLIASLFAQSNVATTSASFLEIGAGARSLAMGGSYVSVADDVSSLYWNPAGIVNLERPSTHVYHSPWLVETNFYHGGAVVPMGHLGTMGVTYTTVTMDEMAVRTVKRPDGTGEKFDVTNVAMGLAYAKRLTERFTFGFQTKFVQEKIWQMSAKGFAVDIGSLFTTSGGLRIGMSVSNFGGKLGMEGINTAVTHDVDETIYGNNDRINANLDVAKWPLPLLFRFGVSKDYSLTSQMKMTLSADGNHPNNNGEFVNAGVEYNYGDMLFLRMGKSHLFLDDAEQGFSYGFGINYQIPRGPKIRMDYVQTDFGIFNSISGYSINLSF